VIQTSDGPFGNRHHRVRSPLFEVLRDAQATAARLSTAGSGGDSYSVWKSTTYREPTQWLYDVVMADGTVVRSRHRLPGCYSTLRV